MRRRRFLTALPAIPLGLALARPGYAALAGGKSINDIQQDWMRLLAPGADVATSTAPLTKTDARMEASAHAGAIQRSASGRNRAPVHQPAQRGEARRYIRVRRCALPLFSSQMKFDSGTGWPSFFTLIPGSLATKEDFSLVLPRTEYHCVRCAGHQGHVFDDGPAPTGLRYCNNGVALRFIPQKST